MHVLELFRCFRSNKWFGVDWEGFNGPLIIGDLSRRP